MDLDKTADKKANKSTVIKAVNELKNHTANLSQGHAEVM